MATIETSTGVTKLPRNRRSRILGRAKNSSVKIENPAKDYVWYEIEETNGNLVGIIGIRSSVSNSGSLADAGVVVST